MKSFIRCSLLSYLAASFGLASAWAAPGDQDRSTTAQATTITMDQLEDNARSYIGKPITVEAEVEEVLGPRLLAVDSPEWFDFDGDTLVFIRAPLAGLVRDGARVTITGTMEPFVRADIEREWGWFGDQPGIEIEFRDRPVLVARSIKSDQGVELAIRMVSGQQSGRSTGEKEQSTAGVEGATGTAGSGTNPPLGTSITELSKLADARDRELVGRHVNVSNARVTHLAEKGGFWVQAAQGDEQLLVVPASPGDVKVNTGQTVSIDGIVLQMPRAMQRRAEKAQQGADESIYVLASLVRSPQ